MGVQSFGSSAQVVQGAGHPPGPGAPLSGPLCDSVLLSTSAGACPLRKVEEGGPAFCTEADLGRQPPRSPAQIATFICLVSLCGFLNPQAASLLPIVNVFIKGKWGWGLGVGIGAIKTALWDSPKVKVKSLSRGRLFGTPWTVVYQAPLSMDFPGKNTGVGCHFLLQEIFPTQGLNPGLSHCRQTLYRLCHQGSLGLPC